MQRRIGSIIYALRKEKGMRQSELASLTGLKQPNLSRIENGLVEPRQSTLEKIARALGMDVSEMLDERRIAEIESKWGYSAGAQGVAEQGLAGQPVKTISVPVFESATGYAVDFGVNNKPTGHSEVTVVLPIIDGTCFGLRVYGDSMESREGADSFRHGEIVIFADRPSPKPGDYAFVKTSGIATFKQIFFDEERVRLVPINRAYQEKIVMRNEIEQMWKLVRHIRNFA
ncbi:MAG: LexA family transcriptional regulator [Planctomycetota bacterium]|nr:LexA family transcriptional regulator [Planctomycetota bacterium]